MDKKLKQRNRKKRINRNLASLKHVIEIEPHKYYLSNGKSMLKEVLANEVKLDGISYQTTIELLQDERLEHNTLKNEIQGALSALTSTLIEKGYNTPNVELNALIEDINKLNIIEPNKEYEGFKFNQDGYVVGLGYELIMEVKEKPDDFDKGYWKIVDGEWVLDSVRYQQIWSV